MASEKKEATPEQLYAARLAESGIGSKEAERLRLRLLTDRQVRKLNASFKDYPAIRIPYFDLRGRETGLYRLRYLGPLRGFDALARKKPRYVQPPDTEPGVYFPPMRNWEKIAADPSVGVQVTEGEFKSAAGTMVGVPTIGLGGVWSWRSKKRRMGFLPALEAFKWKGRDVWLVFDSDYSTNPDVMRALVALAKELAARGAVPRLVTLPDVMGEGRKTGLDDYLVSEGPGEMERLRQDAVPFSQAEELWKLNGEVVYIRDPGLVIEVETGRKMAPGAFKEHAYANRHFYETTFSAKGEERMAKKPLAPAWLQWEQRAELARVTYAPGRPRVFEGMYNYWPGWACEPRRGPVALWQRLLDYVFQGNRDARRWFEQWAAYPVQHAGTKMYACSVLWGHRHGTGKSLVGYSLGRVYGRNFKEIGEDQLGTGFNEWAENRQFVMGDDVGSSGEHSRKATYEFLKHTVTRQTLTVNAKYMPTYEVPDVINYLFTANQPDAFALEDTDRRCFIWQMPYDPLPRSFYDEYDRWLRDPEGLAPALLDHLLRVDLSGFNPRAEALVTEAKRAMILDGKSDVAAWVQHLREHPEAVLRVGEAPIRCDLLSNLQLLSIYDPQGGKRVTANGLGRELKKAGFQQVNSGAVVRTARGPMRLYCVRDWPRWRGAKPEACAEHWDEHFGKRPEDKKPGGKF